MKVTEVDPGLKGDTAQGNNMCFSLCIERYKSHDAQKMEESNDELTLIPNCVVFLNIWLLCLYPLFLYLCRRIKACHC